MTPHNPPSPGFPPRGMPILDPLGTGVFREVQRRSPGHLLAVRATKAEQELVEEAKVEHGADDLRRQPSGPPDERQHASACLPDGPWGWGCIGVWTGAPDWDFRAIALTA